MQDDKKIYELLSNDEGNKWVQLENPKRPENDLKQFLFKTLCQAEFVWFVYGKDNLTTCFQAVSKACPIFKSTSAEQIGVGTLPNFEDFFWIGFESPAGSAILLLSYSLKTPYLLQKQLIYPLYKIQKPWSFGRGKQGQTSKVVAEIFRDAEVLPIWFLDELRNICPFEAGQLDETFCHDLEKLGMLQQQEHIFTMDIEMQQQRHQKVILVATYQDYIKICSPILLCSNGEVPERFLGKAFNEYYLDLFTDELLVLSKLVSIEPETFSLEDLHQQMIRLADYADKVELFGNQCDVF